MTGSFILSDLAAVFNTAEFATAASVRGDEIVTVNGIFENSTVEIEREMGKSMPRQATFECPESSVIQIGSVLDIGDLTYTVRYGDYDGTGVVKWYLEKWRT
jgi:hypothetical protein